MLCGVLEGMMLGKVQEEEDRCRAGRRLIRKEELCSSGESSWKIGASAEQ